jgi:hypothetical protein
MARSMVVGPADALVRFRGVTVRCRTHKGVLGYPADLLVQDFRPHWIEQLDAEDFRHFLQTGESPRLW